MPQRTRDEEDSLLRSYVCRLCRCHRRLLAAAHAGSGDACAVLFADAHSSNEDTCYTYGDTYARASNTDRLTWDGDNRCGNSGTPRPGFTNGCVANSQPVAHCFTNFAPFADIRHSARIDPPPVRGPELKFYATFLNSMDREQNYRWAVYIFRADTQRGIGETTRTDVLIPTGTFEGQSNGSWRLSLGGPCDYFYAQVGWINTENKVIWFTTPSGSVFQKGFTVCPP